jgi:hypothetical protein
MHIRSLTASVNGDAGELADSKGVSTTYAINWDNAIGMSPKDLRLHIMNHMSNPQKSKISVFNRNTRTVEPTGDDIWIPYF